MPDGETIQLQPGETLGGLVKDEAGRPIAGATILLWSHNYKKKDPHELLYDLRASHRPRRSMAHLGRPRDHRRAARLSDHPPGFPQQPRDYDQKEIMPKIADLRAGKAADGHEEGRADRGPRRRCRW